VGVYCDLAAMRPLQRHLAAQSVTSESTVLSFAELRLKTLHCELLLDEAPRDSMSCHCVALTKYEAYTGFKALLLMKQFAS
jgi:hypothetical protein